MTQRLSDETWKLLRACFGDDRQREQIAARLENEVDGDSESMERIMFSIIRLILVDHDKDYLDIAFDLSKTDWRDLLMAAGHGDPVSHIKWAETVIREQPQIVIEEPEVKPVMVDGGGWAECPTCSFRFKLSDPNAWDGKRHKRCLQRLQIHKDR